MKKKYIVFYNMSDIIKSYKKGYIYIITGIDRADNTKIYNYIGCTTKRLCDRMAKHRYHYKLHKQGKLKYCSSFLIYDNCDDIKTGIIQEYNDITLKDLRKYENDVILQHDNIVNINRAYNSPEYNKEYLREKAKIYYENNKEEQKMKKREYYHINRERIRKNYNDNVNNCKDKACIYMKKYLSNEENKMKAINYRNDPVNKMKMKEYQKRRYEELKAKK